MHDFHDATLQEQIFSFLEGDLDAAQEDLLFQTIVDRPDLRANLREFYATQDYVQRDAGRITPPDVLRQDVMRAVGLQSPARQRLAMLLSAAAGLPAVLKHAGGYIAVILATALATYYATENLNESSAEQARLSYELPVADQQSLVQNEHALLPEQSELQQVEKQGSISGEQNDSRPQSPIASADGSGAKEQASAVLTHERRAATVASGHGDVDASVVNLQPRGAMPAQTSIAAAALRPTNAVAQEGVVADKAFDRKPLAASAVNKNPEAWTPFPLMLSLRGFVARSYPAGSLESKSDPMFNNVAAGVFLPVTDDIWLGLECGQEAFMQVFEGREGARLVEIKQNPRLFWAGAALRYELSQAEFVGLLPTANLMVGGTDVGPLAKGLIGLTLRPERHVALSFGFEGSLLAYDFQQTWFTSSKLGIYYGMSYKF